MAHVLMNNSFFVFFIYLSALFSILFAVLALVEILHSGIVKFLPNPDWKSEYKISEKTKYHKSLYTSMILGGIVIYVLVLLIPLLNTFAIIKF